MSTDPGTWTAVGNWQSQVGGGDWDNANPSTTMAAQGGGIYMFQATLTPGSYEWKAVATGSWDSISSERSVNTPNIGFTTDAVNDTARMWVNALNGTTRVEIIPEPSAVLLGALGLLGLLRRRR